MRQAMKLIRQPTCAGVCSCGRPAVAHFNPGGFMCRCCMDWHYGPELAAALARVLENVARQFDQRALE